MKTFRKIALLLTALMGCVSLSYGQQRYTISGSVMDSQSHEPLLGATLYEAASGLGVSTNEYGFFSFTLPAGERELEISYVGYAPELRRLNLTQDLSLNIFLDAAIGIEQVVVYGDRRHSGALSAQMGAIEIPIAQIQSAPTIFGEQE